MSRAVWLFLVIGCGSEPAPDTNTPHSTTSTGVPPTITTTSARPSASVVATPPISASSSPTALGPSDANVDVLLRGGRALSAMPVRATDNGAPIDGKLRSRLSPSHP
jgi:hypothetical protein